MLSLDKTKQVLTEELEELLDAEAPREADSAGAYVESPDAFRGQGGEQIAGVPGAGAIELVGPVLLQWVGAVAFAVCVDLGKEPAKQALKDVWGWFAGLFREGQEIPTVTKKQDTLAAITAALIRAGWDAEKAGATAERVWAQGQRAGQKLAEAA
jgi:hypothetical protein